MANRFAIVNGNFNDTATWATTYNGSGGASVPGAGDSAMANNKTVNITANVTCTDLRNDTQGSAVDGGGFVITNGNATASASTDIVTTATPHGLAVGDQIVFASLVGGIGLVSGTTYRVHASNFGTTTFSVALNADGTTLVDITSDATGGFVTRASLTITANLYSGGITALINYTGLGNLIIIGSIDSRSNTGIGVVTFIHNSAAFVSITGNIYGGNVTGHNTVYNGSTGAIQVTGNVYGGTANTASGIYNASTGSITLVGNSSAGGAGGGPAHGIFNSSSGSVIVIGNLSSPAGITSNSTPSGLYNNSIGTVTVTGTVTGGIISSNYGLYNDSTGIVTINGNIIGGIGTLASGVYNASTGPVTIIGDLTASSVSPAFISSNAAANNRISGNIINAANGMQAIYAQRYSIVTTPTNTYIKQSLNGTDSFLYLYQDGAASSQSGLPQTSDVRYQTLYGPTANLIGTYRVPVPASTVVGALVGPALSFTASRTSAVATATFAAAYPMAIGDMFAVTGAANIEWNTTYTVATVISSTSVTFSVPVTHSSTAGLGAELQLQGTAVLTAASLEATLRAAFTNEIARMANCATVQSTAETLVELL